MEAQSVPAALELVAGGGAGLSPERRAALGASLPLLQRDYRFERVWFWGCVQGVRGAYYIAEGLGPDRAAPRSRLYRCGAGTGPGPCGPGEGCPAFGREPRRALRGLAKLFRALFPNGLGPGSCLSLAA